LKWNKNACESTNIHRTIKIIIIKHAKNWTNCYYRFEHHLIQSQNKLWVNKWYSFRYQYDSSSFLSCLISRLFTMNDNFVDLLLSIWMISFLSLFLSNSERVWLIDCEKYWCSFEIEIKDYWTLSVERSGLSWEIDCFLLNSYCIRYKITKTTEKEIDHSQLCMWFTQAIQIFFLFYFFAFHFTFSHSFWIVWEIVKLKQIKSE